jgi:hypothetical protein
MRRRDRWWIFLAALMTIAAACGPTEMGGETTEELKREHGNYQVGRPAIASAFKNTSQYWSHAWPTLIRLADLRAKLGVKDDAFAGVRPAFRADRMMEARYPIDFAHTLTNIAANSPDLAPFDLFLAASRFWVSERDRRAVAVGFNSPTVTSVDRMLGQAFAMTFEASSLLAIDILAEKKGAVPQPQNNVITCAVPTGADDHKTVGPIPWNEVSTPTAWNTTYDASCVAQATGPCAAKLGIIPSTVTCEQWNDLSKELQASTPHHGDIDKQNDWFEKHGYTKSWAYDGPSESACSEAAKALKRGCDVILTYEASDGSASHQEMVTEITGASDDSTSCEVFTLSWGQSAVVGYNGGTYEGKSDGARYGEKGKWLAGTGKARFRYYCPTK